MIIQATPQQMNSIIALQGNSSFATFKGMLQDNLNQLRKQSDIVDKDSEIHVSRGQRQALQEVLDMIQRTEEEHRKAK